MNGKYIIDRAAKVVRRHLDDMKISGNEQAVISKTDLIAISTALAVAKIQLSVDDTIF